MEGINFLDFWSAELRMYTKIDKQIAPLLHQHQQPLHDLILSSQIFDFPCCGFDGRGGMGSDDKDLPSSKGEMEFLLRTLGNEGRALRTHIHYDIPPGFSAGSLFSDFGENGGTRKVENS